jgi:hypothetical protein
MYIWPARWKKRDIRDTSNCIRKLVKLVESKLVKGTCTFTHSESFVNPLKVCKFWNQTTITEVKGCSFNDNSRTHTSFTAIMAFTVFSLLTPLLSPYSLSWFHFLHHILSAGSTFFTVFSLLAPLLSPYSLSWFHFLHRILSAGSTFFTVFSLLAPLLSPYSLSWFHFLHRILSPDSTALLYWERYEQTYIPEKALAATENNKRPLTT